MISSRGKIIILTNLFAAGCRKYDDVDTTTFASSLINIHGSGATRICALSFELWRSPICRSELAICVERRLEDIRDHRFDRQQMRQPNRYLCQYNGINAEHLLLESILQTDNGSIEIVSIHHTRAQYYRSDKCVYGPTPLCGNGMVVCAVCISK